MSGSADTAMRQHDGRAGAEGGERRGIRTDVSRADVHGRRDPPLRHRDAGEGRHRERRRDARHHAHLDPGGAAGVHLLATAAEDVGVAALEAHDGEPLERPVDEDRG